WAAFPGGGRARVQSSLTSIAAKEAAVNEGRSGRGGLPLIEEGEDVGVGQRTGGLKLAVFLAKEEFPGGIEHRDGGNAAIEGYIVLLGEIEVFVELAGVHVDNDKILSEGGGDFGAVKSVVESVAVAAPIGAEDDENAFVGRRGGMERFVDFLLGVDTGGIEILSGSMGQGRGARGCADGQDKGKHENQEQCN